MNRSAIFFVILSVLAVAFFLANLYFGSVHIPATEVSGAIMGTKNCGAINRFIVLESRFPAAVTALLGGAGLAVAGLLLQTAFRNPLAGPSILGISSGASLGVALVTLLLGSSLSIGPLEWTGKGAVLAGALLGSVAVLGILIGVAARLRNNLMLLITGIMVGYLTSSVVSLLTSLSTATGIQGFAIWGLGTFSGVDSDSLGFYSVSVSIALIFSLLLSKPLNILLLGDGYATNLGINVIMTRNLLLICTGLLTAVITAFCGPIAFIGLAMPHIGRLCFRTDNHWVLIPGVMLCGAIVCLVCNLLSTAAASTVIPINALTPIIGVPVILYIMVVQK